MFFLSISAEVLRVYLRVCVGVCVCLCVLLYAIQGWKACRVRKGTNLICKLSLLNQEHRPTVDGLQCNNNCTTHTPLQPPPSYPSQHTTQQSHYPAYLTAHVAPHQTTSHSTVTHHTTPLLDITNPPNISPPSYHTTTPHNSTTQH